MTPATETGARRCPQGADPALARAPPRAGARRATLEAARVPPWSTVACLLARVYAGSPRRPGCRRTFLSDPAFEVLKDDRLPQPVAVARGALDWTRSPQRRDRHRERRAELDALVGECREPQELRPDDTRIEVRFGDTLHCLSEIAGRASVGAIGLLGMCLEERRLWRPFACRRPGRPLNW